MHKVISPISSCMDQVFPSPQPKGLYAQVKQVMCHIGTGCNFVAILACLLTIHLPAARAQTDPGIEQTFAGSLTAMPPETLGVSGAFYVPVYSSVSMRQGKLRADFSVAVRI